VIEWANDQIKRVDHGAMGCDKITSSHRQPVSILIQCAVSLATRIMSTTSNHMHAIQAAQSFHTKNRRLMLLDQFEIEDKEEGSRGRGFRQDFPVVKKGFHIMAHLPKVPC